VIADVVEAGGQGMDDPDRAAVGDHEDFFAWMEVEHVREEVVHAGREVLEGLGIVGSGALAGAPAPVRIAEAILDLRRRQSFPRAESSLPQPRVDPHFEAQLRGNDLGGLACAGQVARIDHADVPVELIGQRTRLFATQVVEARVGPALPAPVAVPVRFTVPNE